MKIIRLLIPVLITSVSLFLGVYSLSAHADVFSDYVKACKSALGISSIPKFTCKSINFRQPTTVREQGLDFSQSSDWVGHRVINDSVDAVFACRWVEQNNNPGNAGKGEMIVHNRRSGATCFFDLKDNGGKQGYPESDIDPVSPTASNAATFWEVPSNCTQCHSAGPYIASPEIVGALQTFGLINDGHDAGQDNVSRIYHAIGSTASQLNSLIQTAQPDSCTRGCHYVSNDPSIGPIIGSGQVTNAVLMPSINNIINEVLASPAQMPPDDASSDFSSDYRWMNHDRASGSGDWELLSDEANQFYGIYSTCQNPTVLQAHVVDSGDIISSDTPDVLHTFNLRDGLECRNSEQSSGLCHDWQVRYMCNGAWTDWINNDSPNDHGDYERRTDPGYKNLCASPTEMEAKTDVAVMQIVGQAGFPPIPIYAPVPITEYFFAPNDRLEAFDPSYGLACVNSDQPDGKCSNYVVRFICPN